MTIKYRRYDINLSGFFILKPVSNVQVALSQYHDLISYISTTSQGNTVLCGTTSLLTELLHFLAVP